MSFVIFVVRWDVRSGDSLLSPFRLMPFPTRFTVGTMKVLITGAAGLVGSHLARRLSNEHEVLALKRGDLDITDRDAVRRRVIEMTPGLIINCAVLQVDESEQNLAKAQAVNVDGPRYLAEAASEVGAEIVQFSTQYAFAGEPLKRAPYTVKDELNPVNVYGRTKVSGEAAVREACARSYIVRTSWVYGSGKKSFLCVVHNDLRTGKKVRAIDDIWSSTTYVADLIDRVMTIRATGQYGTYHVVNDGVCSYYEFAREAGRVLGLTGAQLDALIEITHERDMKRIAARPRYTPLRCLLSEQLGLPPMRDWRAALAAYVRG
ncbi:MAG: dTDP-4-dehydrorhamnose reductase [Deltaproteobacteria bacterium]|nr:dTDP-4-dehydrorhamnose reductase [Deltaproteobacteria bacterium]